MLAGILANLPFSKSKVALQGVSHQWKSVLQLRSAHSVETWEIDECLPPSPHLPQGDGGISKVAMGLLDALAACNIRDREGSLEWLPLNLEALKVCKSLALEGCPSLPKLRMATFWDVYDCLPPLIPLFPNLESVYVDMTYIEYEEIVRDVMANIEVLPLVRSIKMYAGAIIDLQGHSDCRISFRKTFTTENPSYVIPEGLALNLYDMDLGLDVENMAEGVDLSAFAGCKVLRNLESTVYTDEGGDGIDWRVFGWEKLPAVCSSVTVNLLDPDHDRLPEVNLHSMVGWKADVESESSAIFTRRSRR